MDRKQFNRWIVDFSSYNPIDIGEMIVNAYMDKHGNGKSLDEVLADQSYVIHEFAETVYEDYMRQERTEEDLEAYDCIEMYCILRACWLDLAACGETAARQYG